MTEGIGREGHIALFLQAVRIIETRQREISGAIDAHENARLLQLELDEAPNPLILLGAVAAIAATLAEALSHETGRSIESELALIREATLRLPGADDAD
jgi:hypothetical protein